MAKERTERYENFVEKLKSGHVYTHGGPFHADDVLSTALINQVCDKEGIERPEVHRIFNQQEAAELAQDNIVYDIGKGEFDHHQPDNEVRENGISYAAFGKIYQVVGEQLHGELAATFEKEFVQQIDECDTTIKDSEYYKMIREMQPNWNEKFPAIEAFNNAVRLSEQTISERVENILAGQSIDANTLSQIEQEYAEQNAVRKEQSIAEARSYVQEKMEESDLSVQGKDGTEYKVLQFDRPGVPYEQIKETIEGTNFVGYTFPSRNGYSYKPLNPEMMPMPEEWKGQPAEALPEGMSFCAPNGITLCCDTPEAIENAVNEMVAIHDKELMQETGEEEQEQQEADDMEQEL